MAEEKKITPRTTMFQFKNIDAAEKYFKLKKQMGLKTEKECHDLLIVMSQLGFMKRVQQTSRTPDQVTADFKKHGFNVADLRANVKDGGTKGLLFNKPMSNKFNLVVLIILLFTFGMLLLKYF